MGPHDQTRIAGVLRFNADEIALNRAGRVSDRQRAKLQKSRRIGRAWLVFMCVVVVVFVVLIAVLLVPKLTKQQHGSSSVPIVPLVGGVLAVVVLVMLLSILRSRRSLDRLASGTVHTAIGPAKTRVHRIGGNDDMEGGVRYELVIDKTMFFVESKAVLDAFTPGATYRAYYASGRSRGMNVVLSAEPG